MSLVLIKCLENGTEREKLETVVWNKLYHRSIFEVEKGNVFPEGKLHEDVYVSHLFVQRAGRVAITGEKLYLYRTRTGSIKKALLRKNGWIRI